jgi:nucleotide-binding universal stress UspA family protein
MKPFKRIIAPTDFSPNSAEAVRYAADLSRRYEASLTVVHVYQPIAYAAHDGFEIRTPAQLTELLAEVDKGLANARDDAAAAGAVRVESKLLQGSVFEELMAFASDGAFDLIVMGTHGRTGLNHALLGSIAEKVVRRAPCPVLTVRLAE